MPRGEREQKADDGGGRWGGGGGGGLGETRPGNSVQRHKRQSRVFNAAAAAATASRPGSVQVEDLRQTRCLYSPQQHQRAEALALIKADNGHKGSETPHGGMVQWNQCQYPGPETCPK